MGSPRPGMPVPLDVRALLARDIVTVLIKVGLIYAELPDGTCSYDLGCGPTGGWVLAESYMAAALWYVLGARDILDPGERLGAPSRVLAASGH